MPWADTFPSVFLGKNCSIILEYAFLAHNLSLETETWGYSKKNNTLEERSLAIITLYFYQTNKRMNLHNNLHYHKPVFLKNGLNLRNDAPCNLMKILCYLGKFQLT